ncbi:hypothetical protein BJ912DRAFT_332155 [Pholiota molesta]|nr:hypothetical protein BJ912DRAFT_332155 [Pholiota molesta]
MTHGALSHSTLEFNQSSTGTGVCPTRNPYAQAPQRPRPSMRTTTRMTTRTTIRTKTRRTAGPGHHDDDVGRRRPCQRQRAIVGVGTRARHVAAHDHRPRPRSPPSSPPPSPLTAATLLLPRAPPSNGGCGPAVRFNVIRRWHHPPHHCTCRILHQARTRTCMSADSAAARRRSPYTHSTHDRQPERRRERQPERQHG